MRPKKILLIVSSLLLSGCVQYSTLPLVGRNVLTLPSMQTLGVTRGKQLTIVLGSSLKRLTTNGGSFKLFRRYHDFIIEPSDSNQQMGQIKVELPTLDHLEVSNFNSVTIRIQRPQTNLHMGFADIDQLNIVGATPVYSLYVKNVRQTKINNQVDLRYLKDEGAGLFYAKRLRCEKLTIEKNGSAKVVLRGDMPVTYVGQTGAGEIDLYWMKISRATIEAAGTSVTKLAGLINHLVVNLSEQARLQAQFLRAKSVHVTTSDQSIAWVYPITSLYAQTFGTSKIKYFRKPIYLYQHNAGAGIILPGEWKPSRAYAK